MSTPAPTPSNVPPAVGRIHYSQPRAVMVREEGHLTKIHSAIHGGLNIYVSSHAEAQKVLDNWQSLMVTLNQDIEKIIASTKSNP